MNEQQKPIRIDKVNLKNIAIRDYYKPVTERNNVFIKLRKNNSILSRMNNKENRAELISKSCQVQVDVAENQQKLQKQFTPQKLTRNSSLQESKLSKKIINENLPKINRTKQIRYLDQNQESISKNQIVGTTVGSLSTRQILKVFELKKLRQEQKKREYLRNYIKNLKSQSYEENQSSQNQQVQKQKKHKIALFENRGTHNRNSKSSFTTPIQSIQSSQSLSKNNLSSSSSQQKLLNLLQNRLTDRDYIDMNSKLFQKRDINKKRFFQRYHNILKKQRQEIKQN